MKQFLLISFFAFLIIGLVSCSGEASSSIEEATIGDIQTQANKSAANDKAKLTSATTKKGDDIVRSSATPADPIDSVNVAKIEWLTDEFDYGTVKAGEIVEHVFKYKNTGNQPLVITNARSTCGCTVPKFDREPLPVGETAEISVRFNTKGKKGKQRKPVIVTANTFPTETRTFIFGEVVE